MISLPILLAIVSLPVIGSLAGGLLGDRLRISDRTLSLTLHATAGMLLAVIGVELMPQALQSDYPAVIVLLFLAGGLFLVGIDWGTGFIKSLTGKGDKGGGGFWVIYIGVAIDVFTDGLTIASGSTISQGLALLLGLGLLLTDGLEGFTTIANMKKEGAARRLRLLVTFSLPVFILLGTLLGYWGLRGQPELVRLGVLAFTAGEILALVVSEIIPQSLEQWEGRWATLLLIGGFGLFALLSGFIQ